MTAIGVDDEEKILCCCCCPKIWTTVVGWLGLIGSFLAAFVGTAIFASMVDAGEESGAHALGIIVIIWAVVCLLVLINVLLLVGNEKEKAGYFMPWLTCAWIAIVLDVIGVIGLIFSGMNPQSAFTSLGQLAISGFFLFAVHKRRTEINKGSAVVYS